MGRGDVLLVEFPSPVGETGHEQIGQRPAVVVQADTTGAGFPTVLIIPLTKQLGALHYSHTFQVDPSKTNGLTQPSVVLVFQLRAIDRRRIIRKIGHLEQHYLDQLDTEIRRLLNLP